MLIEEATVDCYDKEEHTSGFLTMVEETLALPFTTRVFSVGVSVVAVESDDDGSLGAGWHANWKIRFLALLGH